MSGQPGDDLKALIYEFVKAFARFEYALQRAECRIGQEGDGPRTCWRESRKKLGGFSWTKEAQALHDMRPTKQIIRDGAFAFEPVDLTGKSDIEGAIALVKAVRNNLFHGGKHDKSDWDDPARICELLPAATKVIHQMADADTKVRAFYRNEF